MYGHKYTDNEKKFMKEFVPEHSYAEIQKAFIERFGWEITIGQVKSYISNNHLNTGRTGCFEKGNVQINKGKKMSAEMYEKAQATMFKKGNIPHNYRPVGSERITKDGYIEVKIADPNKWKLKHKVVWETLYGKVPRGHMLVFMDNDKTNVDVDNLRLVKQSVNLVMNRTGMCNYTGEAKAAAVTLAELNVATSSVKKHRTCKKEQV